MNSEDTNFFFDQPIFENQIKILVLVVLHVTTKIICIIDNDFIIGMVALKIAFLAAKTALNIVCVLN